MSITLNFCALYAVELTAHVCKFIALKIAAAAARIEAAVELTFRNKFVINGHFHTEHKNEAIVSIVMSNIRIRAERVQFGNSLEIIWQFFLKLQKHT